ncbi:thioesterase family protein [Nocardia sp. CDC160]|uniref:thioesterase family protein n=1 Tax=Nocardia sp. CDC160 TaxID=3112166 RepID=UPI002DBFF5D9|nr:thioesterase family protein [Nocardia sp. CDC160]MEC3918640.1 thioesterase family protein [Nocardia sp. CDC160]
MIEVGARSELIYRIPEGRTVPDLYPDSPEFQQIPAVFATGYLVGLMEWACARHLHPHLSPGQTSVGTHIDVSHVAPSLPGMTVTVQVEVTAVQGRRIRWSVQARDDRDNIGEGIHHRAIIDTEQFIARINVKATDISVPPLTRLPHAPIAAPTL